MAIIKKLESSYGVSPDYHRVTNVSINALEKEVIICCSSYISKEARDKGCEPLDNIDILVPKEDYELFLKGNIIEASYNWLKVNVVGFEDSLDDK